MPEKQNWSLTDGPASACDPVLPPENSWNDLNSPQAVLEHWDNLSREEQYRQGDAFIMRIRVLAPNGGP